VSRVQRSETARVSNHPVEQAAVDLEDVLSDALRNLDAALHEADARISREALPVVRGDRGQLVQLFQNLLGNAVKFRADRPPEIHVGCDKRDNSYLLLVRDNGIGIDKQNLGRVFQMFQRLHTRQKYPGTGIGLAICRKIVDRHGGSMCVDSTPGEGSTFYFTLPVPPESADAPPRPPATAETLVRQGR
jgi:light-regulated signal transduction histidine kinase (bacteriophytochrome)